MMRVGSTKIYNTVLKIYEVLGDKDYSVAYINYGGTNYKPDNRTSKHVIKIHDINNADKFGVPREVLLENAIVITAKRDPRDIAASRLGMNGQGPFFNINEDDFLSMESFLRHDREVYKFYEPISDYEVDYELYANDPRRVVRELAVALGKKLTESQVQEVAEYIEKVGDKEYLSSLSKKQLSKMLINNKHITGSKKVADYKNRLTSDYICKIEEKFGNWIVELGYSLDCRQSSKH